MSEILFQDHILAPLRSGREEAKKEEKKLSKNQERIFFGTQKKLAASNLEAATSAAANPKENFITLF
jgi:hypothetical protein